MGNDNSLLIVVIAVIAYIVMTGTKIGGAVSSAVTSACPRGQQYSRGFFGDCAPNYTFGGWFDQDCVCLTQTPASIPDAAHTPQTPAPTLTKCPYNPNLLYGDKRCTALYPQYPASEGSISSAELCNPSSPYYVGDAVANAPGGCYG